MKQKFSILETVKIGMLIAMGIVFPIIFHIFGQTLGRALNPMHIPVLIGGLVLSPIGALIVGALTPLLSFFITGMPPMPIFIIMMFELAIYGFVMAIMIKRFNIIISLIITMILGRVVSGIIVFILVTFFSFKDISPIPYVIGSVTGAIPGIILQLILIPVIYISLKRVGIINEKK